MRKENIIFFLKNEFILTPYSNDLAGGLLMAGVGVGIR